MEQIPAKENTDNAKADENNKENADKVQADETNKENVDEYDTEEFTFDTSGTYDEPTDLIRAETNPDSATRVDIVNILRAQAEPITANEILFVVEITGMKEIYKAPSVIAVMKEIIHSNSAIGQLQTEKAENDTWKAIQAQEMLEWTNKFDLKLGIVDALSTLVSFLTNIRWHLAPTTQQVYEYPRTAPGKVRKIGMTARQTIARNIYCNSPGSDHSPRQNETCLDHCRQSKASGHHEIHYRNCFQFHGIRIQRKNRSTSKACQKQNENANKQKFRQ